MNEIRSIDKICNGEYLTNPNYATLPSDRRSSPVRRSDVDDVSVSKFSNLWKRSPVHFCRSIFSHEENHHLRAPDRELRAAGIGAENGINETSSTRIENSVQGGRGEFRITRDVSWWNFATRKLPDARHRLSLKAPRICMKSAPRAGCTGSHA